MAQAFKSSNYRKHLLQIDKTLVNFMEFHDVIEKHLGQVSPGSQEAYKSVRQSHPDELPPLIAVRVWTGNSLYGDLKHALMTDNDELCRLLAPYMRALNHHLVMQNPREMVTFRGSKMNQEDLNRLYLAWKGNECVTTRVPSYYPSSLSKQQAAMFSKGLLVKFHIPAGCPNCCHIEPWSDYESEQEVLFPPWTAFKIIKVSRPDAVTDGVVLEVEVLDNLLDSHGALPDSLQMVAITTGCLRADDMISWSMDPKERYST